MLKPISPVMTIIGIQEELSFLFHVKVRMACIKVCQRGWGGTDGVQLRLQVNLRGFADG